MNTFVIVRDNRSVIHIHN